jgi:hypothetical protein
MIQVRPATSEDADAVSSLSAEIQTHHAQALPSLFKPSSPVAFPPSEVRALLESPDRVVLVACIDEEVVGYASAQVRHRADTALVASHRDPEPPA